MYPNVSYISFIQHLDFIIFHCSCTCVRVDIITLYICPHASLTSMSILSCFFRQKKFDEKVIYLAKQLTIPLSLKSCETVLFTIYAERGKNACELEVYKPTPPPPLKTRLVWVAMYQQWVAAFNHNQSIFSIILTVNFNFSISQLPLMLTLTMIYSDVINRQTD